MNSKPLLNTDESGTIFTIEMLKGDKIYGLNFDCIYNHPEYGDTIIELLLCEEKNTIK